jgi:hypothetical protein
VHYFAAALMTNHHQLGGSKYPGFIITAMKVKVPNGLAALHAF